MDKEMKLESMLEKTAWSALLIWWGLCFIPRFLPNGLDAAGTGIILLGAGVIRRAGGMRVNGFSVGAGILCLVWGVLDMTVSVFHAASKPPVFAILLMVLGAIVLASAFFRRRIPD